jgi:hypothetical protein
MHDRLCVQPLVDHPFHERLVSHFNALRPDSSAYKFSPVPRFWLSCEEYFAIVASRRFLAYSAHSETFREGCVLRVKGINCPADDVSPLGAPTTSDMVESKTIKLMANDKRVMRGAGQRNTRGRFGL